ncbi:acyl-CoA dehydrogenase family protein [Colwellia sp. 12G3]|uniref:acyl-CoA dehydrogenase family protein n=1 Tax=Colwellia sp. 12G3 TaxID=2058299 RepID=UPI000C31BC0C|nr:acyl-CoA dehydrogenase family protein [Colwellia sp. 12G3]PKI16199.1 acyl-CoA dehydrogenase [Colwellia sp. 12G3]
MFNIEKVMNPNLGLTGFDAVMSEEELAIQDVAHRFAAEVMRPIGENLDKMSAEDVIAPESPLWDYIKKMDESGILDLEAIGGMSDDEKARIIPIIFEELAWGDCGLALTSMVLKFPAFAAYNTGNPELIERFGKLRGCWVATQPDKGSEIVDMEGTEIHPGGKQNKGNLVARVDGDELVITGQSSAWVSATPIAECGLCYLPCDYGDGVYKENGSLNQIAVLVPFDLPGVSKGKPLDKMGMRSLCQGEVFFDEVRVPMSYVIADKESAFPSFIGALTFGNMEMGISFTGVARAAYEHALAYAHERKQGGVAIIEHQSVKLRLFKMQQKVEACRALALRVFAYNYGPKGPHLLASITSKTFVSDTCVEVTSEAIQILGGNGLTKEYPTEKLFRDARTAQIADGENNILGLKAARWLSKEFIARNG